TCALIGLFFFQAEDGIRDATVTGVQTCALPISLPTSTATASRSAGDGGRGGGVPGRARRIDRDAVAVEVGNVEPPPCIQSDAEEIGRASCRERGWREVPARWIKRDATMAGIVTK